MLPSLYPSCFSPFIILSCHLSKLHPLSTAALPGCRASVCVRALKIITINHCPAITAGNRDTWHFKRVVCGFNIQYWVKYSAFNLFFCLKSTYLKEKNTASEGNPFNFGTLFTAASVKVKLVWTVSQNSLYQNGLFFLRFTFQQRITLINDWCGVDVEHEPGPPHISPPMDQQSWGGRYTISQERVIWPYPLHAQTSLGQNVTMKQNKIQSNPLHSREPIR